jgi:hypothetical protein
MEILSHNRGDHGRRPWRYRLMGCRPLCGTTGSARGAPSKRVTPAWVIQVFSGLKIVGYLSSLCVIPFEVNRGHPFNNFPYADFPETGWRTVLRLATLLFWLAVFLWAGGKIIRSTTQEKGKISTV